MFPEENNALLYRVFDEAFRSGVKAKTRSRPASIGEHETSFEEELATSDLVLRLLKLRAGSSALINYLSASPAPGAIERAVALIGRYALKIDEIEKDPRLKEEVIRAAARLNVFEDFKPNPLLPASSSIRENGLKLIMESLLELRSDALVASLGWVPKPPNGESSLAWEALNLFKDSHTVTRLPSPVLWLLLEAGATTKGYFESEGPITDSELEAVRVLYQGGVDGAFSSLEATLKAARAL